MLLPFVPNVQWFDWDPNWFEGHYSNAFEKEAIVYCHFPIINGNVIFPPHDEPFGNAAAPPRRPFNSYFARFKLDPKASELRLPDPERIGEISGEFSRIDDRFQGKDYEWTYIAATDGTKPYDLEKAHNRRSCHMGFNCAGRMTNRTKKTDYG
jgi:carotenoid cleavage dioxygenase-like enzyme